MADLITEHVVDTAEAEEPNMLSAADYGVTVEQHAGVFNAQRVRFLVYAESGVGKTVFGSTWPNSIFLDIDDGLSSVQKPVGRVEIKSWRTAQKAVEFLMFGTHEYKTAVIDSLNELQVLCIQNVIRAFPNIRRPYDNLASLSDYGKALTDFDNFIRNLKALPMNVVFIANRAQQEYDTDAVQPQFVGKSTARNVARMMDVIGYMYRQEGGDTPRKTRIMVFDAINFVTKDRSDKLPPFIENPTYTKLYEYWKE